MDTLFAWPSQYSTPVVTLLALSAAGIYVLKNVMESAISAQFNKHTRQIELLLERRARFEEKVLLDQYELVKALQADIIDVGADLNRHLCYWRLPMPRDLPSGEHCDTNTCGYRMNFTARCWMFLA